MTDDIKALTQTLIQSKVIEALHDTPEAVDLLVRAAFEQEVDEYGGKPDYHSRKKMPFLEWLVGNEIRNAAREAVRTVIEERKGEIHDAVRRAVQADDLVDGLMQKILRVLDQEYRVDVTFADEKD